MTRRQVIISGPRPLRRPLSLRISLALAVIDHALGAFVSVTLVSVLAWTIIETGPLNQSEKRELGDMYVNTLGAIETSAHQLRGDYCDTHDCALAERQTGDG